MRRSPDGGRGFVVTVCRRAAAGSRSRMEIGYALSSEEHEPLEPVRNAVRAEEAGFGYALVSDHYHPWIDRQGHSPFGRASWAASLPRRRSGSALGRMRPLIRIHPAIVAQAAATSAALMPGDSSSASGPART